MTETGEATYVPVDGSPEEQEEGSPEEEQEGPQENRVKLRISVFFDGTMNNRANTGHRSGGTATFAANADQSSYQNDLSNVARMEDYVGDAEGYDHSTSIYVEGIGTTSGDGDSPKLGGGLGTGETGVRMKVELGMFALIRWIREETSRDDIIEKLTVDAFGFSRGAAAARSFIDRVRRLVFKQRFYDGTIVEELDIGFIGLYDTVAAHGVVHRNDTSDLSLDAVRHARYVLQLAAAEEYRNNFSLTNINSAPNGRQIYLPGAHSDVGGGYIDRASEHKTLYSGVWSRRLATRLVAEGWYTGSELNFQEIVYEGGSVSLVRVNRANISNKYSYIPLHIMADFATEHGLNINGDLRTQYSIPGALGPVKSAIDAHVASGGHSGPATWAQSWAGPNLRHDYLHFSASTSIGMGLRLVGGEPMRRVYAG